MQSVLVLVWVVVGLAVLEFTFTKKDKNRPDWISNKNYFKNLRPSHQVWLSVKKLVNEVLTLVYALTQTVWIVIQEVFQLVLILFLWPVLLVIVDLKVKKLAKKNK